MSTRRIQKEIKIYQEVPVAQTTLEVTDDLRIYKLFVFPSQSSIYLDAKIEFKMTFPDGYPMEPFKLKIVSDVYHPVFSQNRESTHCSLDCILGERWSPALIFVRVLPLVVSVFEDPTEQDLVEECENIAVLRHAKEDWPDFVKRARQSVLQSCYTKKHFLAPFARKFKKRSIAARLSLSLFRESTSFL
mmetsp:Transcript_19621/g.22308  ORF Transcript_19621/g.22308 Transcript_19621/m.22308 type:complete len:189 (+) Transcript_19621:1425-1991(+)